jgi:hypothetical protein
MSYEISQVALENEAANPWVLTDLQWTGACILQRSAAAYQGTSIALAAGWARVA